MTVELFGLSIYRVMSTAFPFCVAYEMQMSEYVGSCNCERSIKLNAFGDWQLTTEQIVSTSSVSGPGLIIGTLK